MTEQYAMRYPNIHFSAMHPGWADVGFFLMICDEGYSQNFPIDLDSSCSLLNA